MEDVGRQEVDQKLENLENRISEVYKQAAEETQAKLDNYLRRFQIKDKIKREKLDKGEITRDEYNYWRTGQIMISKRWQELKDDLAKDFTNANKIASSLMAQELPDVYAIGHNYAAYQMEHDSMLDMSFTLYDRRTVEQLLTEDEDLLPEPRVNIPKDERWNRQQIQSAILQGMLQGEPIDKISKRLQKVSDMNNNAAIRNARTAMTGAENAGRVNGYKHAMDMGIDLEQEWLATLDERTRDSHRHLDGERVEVGGKFSNGCRFPGDPQGHPREVYNCRCTLVAAIKGIDQSAAPRNSKLGDMSYEEWKNEHTKQTPKTDAPIAERKVVEGKDITGAWERDYNAFDYAIEDVMHTQGFDGLPRVVSSEEFEELYTGNQPLLFRTYTAPDEETAQAFHKMLTDGKWYVNCSTGGAQYGQGMYCAGIYDPKGSKQWTKHYNGAMAEMNHYQSWNKGSAFRVEKMTLDPSAKIADYKTLTSSADYKASWKNFHREELYHYNHETVSKLQQLISDATYLTDKQKASMLKDVDKCMASMEKSYAKGSAIKDDLFGGIIQELGDKQLGFAGDPHKDFDAYLEWKDTFKVQKGSSFTTVYSEKLAETDAMQFSKNAYASVTQDMHYAGIYATEKGYDAINAKGHGESGSYTVVLNRTKVIMQEG